MMQCAVHPKEYSRVSTCKSAMEMWDKLELIYEGTPEYYKFYIIKVSFVGQSASTSADADHGKAAISMDAHF
ncbi:hypothetical protein Taro_008454 [Colocasia esculenta]|uniref:Uncharacterized protein n=1 Tax=Colocasia esculenta TaxID=4460 RepID=A0A843U709_COLES|nr:hypothetical protein [Colocasia esculenta]